MNLLLTGTGRSGTKALQLFLTMGLLQKYPEVHLNYEPYLWKTRKGGFSFEGCAHHCSDPLFPHNQQQLSIRHRNYFYRLGLHDQPVVTKCIRGLGRMPFLKADLRVKTWIHIIRDVYEVVASLQRQEWNLFELGPPVFPFKKKDLWPKYIQALDVIGVSKPLKKKIREATEENDKNAICWYLDNLSLLCTKNGPDHFLSFEDLKSNQHLVFKSIGLRMEGLPFSFVDLKGSEVRKSSFLLDIPDAASFWDPVLHQWNEKVYRLGLSQKLLLAERMGTKVRMHQNITKKAPSFRPKKPASQAKNDLWQELQLDIKLKTKALGKHC